MYAIGSHLPKEWYKEGITPGLFETANLDMIVGVISLVPADNPQCVKEPGLSAYIFRYLSLLYNWERVLYRDQ